MTATEPPAAPRIAQHLFLPDVPGRDGFCLYFRRHGAEESRKAKEATCPAERESLRAAGRAKRDALLASARAEPTAPARRKAFVVGCLCTADGTPQSLPPAELTKLDAMTLDDWDACLLKAAFLNGFTPLQVVMD